MKTRTFDIALPLALALPLAAHIDAILAGTDEDGPPDADYSNWAINCAGRLRSGDGEYVSLDEEDISMLASDVLPEFLDTRIGAVERLVDEAGDRDQMLLASGHMGSAVKLMARLHRAINFDMFDQNWIGDRA